MNRLSRERRTAALEALVEGIGVRAASRITGVQKNTLFRLIGSAGGVAAAFQSDFICDLQCRRLELDEIWSFVYCKQKKVFSAKAAPAGAGDQWTWVAIDPESKLVPSWLVGDRTASSCAVFLKDLASRLKRRVQLTTDGYRIYLDVLPEVFRGRENRISFGMVTKLYGLGKTPEEQRELAKSYVLAPSPATVKEAVWGEPDMDHTSTSIVERHKSEHADGDAAIPSWVNLKS